MKEGEAVTGIAKKECSLLTDKHNKTTPCVSGECVNINMYSAEVKAIALGHIFHF